MMVKRNNLSTASFTERIQFIFMLFIYATNFWKATGSNCLYLLDEYSRISSSLIYQIKWPNKTLQTLQLSIYYPLEYINYRQRQDFWHKNKFALSSSGPFVLLYS